MDQLFFETWGSGPPIILVHGSLATGTDEWAAQLPLAAEGFCLIVPDRRGYGRSPTAAGEDYLADAEDVVGMMGDGAHLVGHSYGGLAVMLAAARRPQATRSLTLLEPATFSICERVPEARPLVAELRRLLGLNLPDEDWLVHFLRAVGSDPESLPPDLLSAALPVVPVCRYGRSPLEAELPLEELAKAAFPKLVVSGGHSAAFDAMAADLASRIGGDHMIIPGAGHEVQFTGPPLNDAMARLWRSAPSADQ